MTTISPRFQRPFFWTDAPSDAAAYPLYVAGLDNEALRDVADHLDKETYPGRWESLTEEMQSRGLLHANKEFSFSSRVREVLLLAGIALCIVAPLLCVLR